IAQEHRDAVEAKRDSPVWWRAVAEGLQQKAELLRGLFLREPQCRKDLGLHIAAMDTNRPAADLVAVEHEVVSLRANPGWIALQDVEMLEARRRERVMRRDPLALIVLLE